MVVLKAKRTVYVQRRPRLDAAEFAAREAAKAARSKARALGAEASAIAPGAEQKETT